MKKLDITAQKIVQHTLQSAMEGGPNCPILWFYQPHRPEKPLPKPFNPLTDKLPAEIDAAFDLSLIHI